MREKNNMSKLYGILNGISQTLKHLRGRHDQRDHAWNRGMGRGGAGDIPSDASSTAVNQEQYRALRNTLGGLVRQGLMKRIEMRNELRKYRGQQLSLTRNRRDRAMDLVGAQRIGGQFGSLQENVPAGGLVLQSMQSGGTNLDNSPTSDSDTKKPESLPTKVKDTVLKRFSEKTKERYKELKKIIDSHLDSGQHNVASAVAKAFKTISASEIQDNEELLDLRDSILRESYGIADAPDDLSGKFKKAYNRAIDYAMRNIASNPNMESSDVGNEIGMALSSALGDLDTDKIATARIRYGRPLLQALQQEYIKFRQRFGLMGKLYFDSVTGGMVRDTQDRQIAKPIPPLKPHSVAQINTERQRLYPFTPAESADFVVSTFKEEVEKIQQDNGYFNESVAFNVLTTIIQQLSESEQIALVNNSEATKKLEENSLLRDSEVAVGVYGHPEARLSILKDAEAYDPALYAMISKYTIDGVLLSHRKKQEQGIPVTPEDYFTAFMKLHTDGFHVGGKTAALQELFSYIGPNAKVPRENVRSFYPDGVAAPLPHPDTIKYLNEIYEAQQEYYKKLGITEIPLYRGGRLHGGLPMESWSLSRSISEGFGVGVFNSDSELRSAMVPVEYIFGNYVDTDGYHPHFGEQEFAILASSMYNDGTATVYTDGNYARADAVTPQPWHYPQMLQMPNAEPPPPSTTSDSDSDELPFIYV